MKLRNTYVKLRNTYVKLKKTYVKLKNIYVKLRNTYVKLRNTYVKLRNTYVKLRNAYVKLRNTYVKLKSTYVKLKNTYVKPKFDLIILVSQPSKHPTTNPSLSISCQHHIKNPQTFIINETSGYWTNHHNKQKSLIFLSLFCIHFYSKI